MTEGTKFAKAPGAWPLVGHVPRIARGLPEFLESLPAHGDLVEVRVGWWRAYVVCSAELAVQILRDDRTFDKGGPIYDQARDFAGNGMATCPYRDHRRQRRLLQPAFGRDRIPGYAEVMSERIDGVTGAWHDGQVIDVLKEMCSITISVATDTLFTTGVDESAAAKLRESVNTVFASGFRQMIMPRMLRRLPTPENRRYARANTHLRVASDQIIKEYRRRGIDHGDILSKLLAARDEDGEGRLSDSEVYDQVVTLLLASIETTASTLSWAGYLLARHPEIQDAVYAEAHAVLNGRAARFDDLPHLQLAGRVVHETLRLYPPGWLFTRTVRHDTELAGVSLPAGATVFYSPYLLHHRADLFDEPERFAPDRWQDPALSERPDSGFMPFATGARQCIGNEFALVEATLALATLADRWRLGKPAARVSPVLRLTLNPPPLTLRVHRRRAATASDTAGSPGAAVTQATGS
ncbi:cytochrome P450 [Kitasatospora sp. NPDC048239]|uniref:cytochrome P450 n=1 Tax=Kitasatospora sp. NPDC048239 TaxID=3364046 RepID=UPI00371D8CFE